MNTSDKSPATGTTESSPRQGLPAVSVVVPVYNSELTLDEFVARVSSALAPVTSAFEIVLVNDGSRDGSWSVASRIAKAHSYVRAICLMRNYGQHNALLAGIRAASFPITVTMDDDLQHPPEELPKLILALSDELDVVYAPPEVEQHGLFRDAASIITKIALGSVMGSKTARLVSAWRIFRTQIRDAFASYHSPFVSIDVLLTWGTTRFSAVPLRHDPRTVGKSNYTFRQLTRHAMTMITGFSVLPLKMASFTGFAATLFGIGILAYVLIRYMWSGSRVAGFPFLASIIAIFSGAQLFALGILGEYLARVHFRTMDKPTYAVKLRTDDLPSS